MAENLIEIQYDKASLRRVSQLLQDIPNALPMVVSRGINRTLTSARAEIARRIANEIKITQAAVKKGLRLQKATYRRWVGIVSITTKRIPLINFAARQTKKGVTYRIATGGARKLVPSAFIQTMPSSGHVGVFKRLTTKRKPIIELKGPSIGIVFERAGQIAAEVQKSLMGKLVDNINAQLNYILAKRKAEMGKVA